MTEQPSPQLQSEDNSSETVCQPQQRVATTGASLAKRSKSYQRWRLVLTAAQWVVEVCVMGGLLFAGWTLALREAALRYTNNPWLIVAFYLLPVGLLLAVVSMSFSAIRSFFVDRRFGLSTESFGVWFADEIKEVLVGGALAFVAVEVLYVFLRLFAQTWWIWAGLTFSVFLLLLIQVAPVLIFPLFYRFTRITDSEMTERLERLAKQAGKPIEGVYEVNLSRKSRAANAALVGFGRTRRIVLADNLLDNFTLDEIEAVLAHEFGHHVHHHLIKIAIVQSAAFFGLFYAIDCVMVVTSQRFAFNGPADVANFPLIALSAAVLGLVVLPAMNAVLRRFEREADDYVINVVGKAGSFANALHRLAQINLVDQSPSRIVEWVFHSHPAISERVERAERAIARN
ncbi:M48 family metallopeptidase [Candidatus Sumerlaeota bacterium]|nr:M48 family metallopeptidase [Candidatus Sumerlaeota bacterium]